MKKNLKALVLTLGILVTTGLSSTVYATDNFNYIVKPGDNMQKIFAQFEAPAPKCLSVKPQVTNPTKTTPCKTPPVKVTIEKTIAKKVTPKEVVPKKIAPKKVTVEKEIPKKVTPAKVTPTETTPTKATIAAPNLTEANKLEKEVVMLVNQERAKLGLAPLKHNLELSNVARYKSEDMITNNYFDHISPTYGSPFDMITSFGIQYTAAGENIAMGQQTAASVMNAWMNSPGHKANILSENYTEIGVGVAKDKNGSIYWTQQFIGK